LLRAGVNRLHRAQIDPGIGAVRDAADLLPFVKWLCGSTGAIFCQPPLLCMGLFSTFLF
jgi:hypothetical protein